MKTLLKMEIYHKAEPRGRGEVHKILTRSIPAGTCLQKVVVRFRYRDTNMEPWEKTGWEAQVKETRLECDGKKESVILDCGLVEIPYYTYHDSLMDALRRAGWDIEEPTLPFPGSPQRPL